MSKINSGYNIPQKAINVRLPKIHKNVCLLIIKHAMYNKQSYVKKENIGRTEKAYDAKWTLFENGVHVKVKDIQWIINQAKSCKVPPMEAYYIYEENKEWLSLAVHNPGRYMEICREEGYYDEPKPEINTLEKFMK